jgi:excisionase family DNA binding protein
VAEYLDLDGVAEILGVARDTAYLLVRSGELPGIKMGIGWRVERTEASRYGDSH